MKSTCRLQHVHSVTSYNFLISWCYQHTPEKLCRLLVMYLTCSLFHVAVLQSRSKSGITSRSFTVDSIVDRRSQFTVKYKWCGQWRRLHRARGHVPPLLQMTGHGGTVSRTANKKPIKLYTDHHESAHQNDCRPTRRTKKVEGHDQKSAGRVPPTFKFVSAPLSTNAIRCQ